MWFGECMDRFWGTWYYEFSIVLICCLSVVYTMARVLCPELLDKLWAMVSLFSRGTVGLQYLLILCSQTWLSPNAAFVSYSSTILWIDICNNQLGLHINTCTYVFIYRYTEREREKKTVDGSLKASPWKAQMKRVGSLKSWFVGSFQPLFPKVLLDPKST